VARLNRSLLHVESKLGVWQVKRPLRPTLYYFGTATKPYREFGKRWYADALERQGSDPVKLHEFDGRTWWWFKKQVYVERERLSAEDVKALALQFENAKSATLKVAHAEMRGEAAAASPRPREPIPEEVRHEVWRRDQGRCVDCGSRSRLEFDHIIPWSEGGSNTARNIELRCESCNRKKGADT
jgi:5-methylcytosine-specific restriction endonuclease McrA